MRFVTDKSLWRDTRTREQYLADKDIETEFDKTLREDARKMHRPGYAKLMKLKGQFSEERNNGM